MGEFFGPSSQSVGGKGFFTPGPSAVSLSPVIWTYAGPINSTTGYSIVAMSALPGVFVAGGENNDMYLGASNGTVWTIPTTLAHPVNTVDAAVVSGTSTVLVGTINGRYFLSTDGGNTYSFATRPAGFSAVNILATPINAAGPDYVFGLLNGEIGHSGTNPPTSATVSLIETPGTLVAGGIYDGAQFVLTGLDVSNNPCFFTSSTPASASWVTETIASPLILDAPTPPTYNGSVYLSVNPSATPTSQPLALVASSIAGLASATPIPLPYLTAGSPTIQNSGLTPAGKSFFVFDADGNWISSTDGLNWFEGAPLPYPGGQVTQACCYDLSTGIACAIGQVLSGPLTNLQVIRT